MNTPLSGSKSATPVPTVPNTPTPDAAKPGVVLKDTQAARGQEGGKPSDHERRKRISDAAYYKAERRGFTPGEEERDWLEAESEIDGGKEPGKLRPEENTFPSPK